VHAVAEGTGSIEYNRDVRPILADKCFKCHGPDANARKADLRLDRREDALALHDGGHAIVPGKADESELVRRIETQDSDERMPPDKSNLELSRAEAATLRRWITEGAEYQVHWSLVAPRLTRPECQRRLTDLAQRAPAEAAPLRGWARNGIDDYVLDRLLSEGLAPSREADHETLARRLSLVLTGLPPSPDEVTAFVLSARRHRDAAVEALVDRLLDSPRFGEHMAAPWLDAARYADTNGYFRDDTRQAWPWRDWVVGAFNRNLGFDQFTIEQLAGDLLPGASIDQKIATGFNRNHMVTGESGIIDEEYRVQYVADRLETTGTVWLGLTVGCCRCHDHKYDPLTQREYYQLFSFFNNGPEAGLVKEDDPPPTMDVTTNRQRTELQRLHAMARDAGEQLRRQMELFRGRMQEWEHSAGAELSPPDTGLVAHVEFEPGLSGADDVRAGAAAKGGNVSYAPGVAGDAALFDAMEHVELPADLPIDGDRPWTIGVWLKPTGSLNCVLSKIDPAGDRRGFEMIWQKGQLQINLVHRWVASAIEIQMKGPMNRTEWHQVVVSYDGTGRAAGMHVFVDGAEAATSVVRDSLSGPTANTQPLRIGRRDDGLGFYGLLDELRLFRRALTPAEAGAWYWSDRLRGILALPSEKRDLGQKLLLQDYYVAHHTDEPTRAAHAEAGATREAEEAFRASLPRTLVMQDLPQPRVAYLLKRGQYDQLGEEVRAGVPESLPAFPADAPRNRLGLARWIASAENPLTARVAVNRLWQQCFGEGLVRTVNDFGLQGEPPTHPELLDWLALRFVRSGWDVKALVKLMVTSATWRQSSALSADLRNRDPENRLLARGPRYRLSAETIRDQALAVSGLLSERLGGPSVRPYQPAGLWEAVSYDGELTYEPSKGGDLWRRSLYTFWKRQSPPPALLAFDGPTRETCVVRRARTNTPLQALVLLNDDTYVEAGRALAAMALRQAGSDDSRLAFAFGRVLARAPADNELAVLRRLLDQQRRRLSGDAAAGMALVSVGESPAGRSLEPAELAAWTVTMHALLNLDETLSCR